MKTDRLAYNEPNWLDTLAAWLLALLWILPLVYATWTAFHPPEFSTSRMSGMIISCTSTSAKATLRPRNSKRAKA